jgi:hypothetical protein
VFAINAEGELWMQVFDPATGTWLFGDATVVVPGGLQAQRNSHPPVVVATADRLYLFAFDSRNQLFSTSKQVGNDPVDGWDGRWEQRSLPLSPVRIHAANVGGNIYLIRSDQSWAQFEPLGDLLMWQQGGMSARGAVQIRNNDAPFAYIVTAADSERGAIPLLHPTDSSQPFPWGTGCPVDALSYDSLIVTGFQDTDQSLFIFYTNSSGVIQATISGTDGDGYLGCSTWTGAASLFFTGDPPAVAPLPEAGTALLFSRPSQQLDSNRIYVHRFTALLDIVPEISARSSAVGPGWEGVLPSGRFNARGPNGGIPGFSGTCAPELVIAIHGWTNASDDGQDKFQRAYRGLLALGYPYPIVGFSWPADTGTSFIVDNAIGFDRGKEMANMSAPALAAALQSIARQCPEMRVRLLAHSLGNRVLLQALNRLDQEPEFEEWRSTGQQVTSIHLLGAAVDSNVVQTNGWAGPGIEHQVLWAFNYFSEEDSILESVYYVAEAHDALGETGIEERWSAPSNYIEHNITGEIGSDHKSYWSLLNADGSVADVRAMDDVLTDFLAPGWREVPGDERTPDAPAAAVHKDQLFVFTRQTDDTLALNTLDTSEHWSGWIVIPGLPPVVSAPAALTLLTSVPCIAAFFRTPEGDVAYTAECGRGWISGLIPVTEAQRATSAPTVAAVNYKVWLFVQGPDGRLFENHLSPFLTRDGSFFFLDSGWAEIPGGAITTSPPAAATFGQLTQRAFTGTPVNLFIRGLDGAIYHNYTFGLSWSDWTPLTASDATPVLDGPTAIVRDYYLSLFAVDEGSLGVRQTMLHYDRDPRRDWSPWDEVDGNGQTTHRVSGAVFQEKLYLFITGHNDGVWMSNPVETQ